MCADVNGPFYSMDEFLLFLPSQFQILCNIIKFLTIEFLTWVKIKSSKLMPL